AMARELAAAVHSGGGLITAKDLAEYEVKERRPGGGKDPGYGNISAPPPHPGGLPMLESLNILGGYDPSKGGNRSATSIHLTVEAYRRAFYDRAEFLGDPDYSQIPVAQLIDKKYAAAWRDMLDPLRATDSKELVRPSGFGELDRPAAKLQSYAVREPDTTTHYSVVDPTRTAV